MIENNKLLIAFMIFFCMFVAGIAGLMSACISPAETATQTEYGHMLNMFVVNRDSLIDEYGYTLVVDENTDVVYISYNANNKFGITPMMKADGTCMTFTELSEGYWYYDGED